MKTRKSIQDLKSEIIKEFQQCPDVDTKYAHLFKLGAELPLMDPSLKIDENLVKGCQSNLWFYLQEDQGRLRLEADSDSMVIKGIAALLVRLIENREAKEIESIDMNFIDQLNIWKLASERNNGLMAILDHIKKVARLMTQES